MSKQILRRIKEVIKQNLYAKLGIDYNPYGIPISLFKYIKNTKDITLIDVGAHNGSFCMSIAKHCKISRAILIEPLPHKAAKLRKNFDMENIDVLECVVSSTSGVVDFEVNGLEATSSLLKIKHEMPELSNLNLGKSYTIKCQAKTLDEIIEDHQFPDIDLIKIDVQGSEHLVIKGAIEALKRTKMVWTEISFKVLYEGSSDFKEVYHLFDQNGFKLMELQPGFRSPLGELLQADALFVRFDD